MEDFFEFDIYKKGKGIIKHTLSNDFINLINAYIRQTGGAICLRNEIVWKQIENHSKSEIRLMNEFNSNFLLSYYMKGNCRIIKFMKCENNKWYYVNYRVNPKPSEKANYYKKSYPFYYYSGYICGAFIGILKKILGMENK